MYGIEAWHLWLIAGIVLITLEIFVSDFFLALIGVAALVTVFAAAAGLEFVWQLAIFVGVSLVLLPTVRPLVKKWFYDTGSQASSNVDALAGQTALVSETIGGSHEPGRVQFGSEIWRAVTADDSAIEEGSKVEIIRVEGATLVVRFKPLPKPQS